MEISQDRSHPKEATWLLQANLTFTCSEQTNGKSNSTAHPIDCYTTYPRAMGFKPGSGTRDAVATFIHDISEAKHRSAHKQQGVAVFLDLKKAFEMGQSLMSWLPLGSAVTYSHGVATS